MSVSFTAHNILLKDGSLTREDTKGLTSENPIFRAAKRVLDILYPSQKNLQNIHIADLGCLEGGYSAAFSEVGYKVTGIEVRKENYKACCHVKEFTSYENLSFKKDNVWNAAKYGPYDVTFCCGLLYHLDEPEEFISYISQSTTKAIILHTHFASRHELPEMHHLSEICTHNNMQGRWATEYANEEDFKNRENFRWSSWDNEKSFWPCKEHILEMLKKNGFDTIFEQYDYLGNTIASSVQNGTYYHDSRGMFVGIKA